MLELPEPHNPALPEERRRLAAKVLRAGTALALDLVHAVALQAERDAGCLSVLHGSAEKVLWRTGQ